jgi:ABC-2 type transport system permease protein
VLRLELLKLRALRRTYLGIGGAAIIPVVLLIALEVGEGGPPDEVPFARSVAEVGFAIPLFALAFASFFLLPLLASLVAGDAISGEIQGATLKTLLTRSVSRSQVFVAKLGAVAVYALVLLAAQAVVGTLAGVIVLGTDPLPTLSGTTAGPGEALVRIALAFAVASITLMAIASFTVMLSTLTQNTVAAIGGTVVLIVVLQVMSTFESLSFLRPYLVTEQTNAWFGVIRDPVDWWPMVRAAIVNVCWAVPCLVLAWRVFVWRDVLGG